MLYTKEIAIYSETHDKTYRHGVTKRQSSLMLQHVV